MDGGMGVNRYWCYNCEHVINPIRIGADMVQCPLCQGGFVEDIASSGVVDSSSSSATSSSREDDFSDFLATTTGSGGGSESDRALSLWAPILLGMMSNPRRRRRLRRRLELEDEAVEEEEENENNNNNNQSQVESIDPRRRRSSATILQLLQGIRAGMLSESENNNNNNRRRESDRENSILINPFDHSIILNGPSFGSDNRNNHNHRIGSLGDYFVGPGLDLLLQHLAENDPNRYGTPPAQKAVVETMPSVRINDNSSQCSVCLDDFEVGKEAKEMPCKHKFHSGCILPWLELHSSCPVCRYQLPLDEPKVDNNNNNNNDIIAAAVVDGGGVDDGNRRRFSLPVPPIPWPLSSLFSSPSSSSLGSTSRTRTDEDNNNNNSNNSEN